MQALPLLACHSSPPARRRVHRGGFLPGGLASGRGRFCGEEEADGGEEEGGEEGQEADGQEGGELRQHGREGGQGKGGGQGGAVRAARAGQSSSPYWHPINSVPQDTYHANLDSLVVLTARTNEPFDRLALNCVFFHKLLREAIQKIIFFNAPHIFIVL